MGGYIDVRTNRAETESSIFRGDPVSYARPACMRPIGHPRLQGLSGLLWVVLLLQACASYPSVTQDELAPDFDFATAPGTGLVVGSVVALPDDRYNPPYFVPAAYFYAGVDAPQVRGVLRSGHRNADDWLGQLITYDGKPCAAGIPAPPPASSDWPPRPEPACGRLFAVALPAGRYRVQAIQTREPNATSIETADKHSLAPSDFEWTVVAGEIRYLGELRSHVCYPVYAVRGEVRDEFERDLPLLEAAFPAVRAQAAIRSVIRTPAWVWIPPRQPQDAWPELCWPLLAD